MGKRAVAFGFAIAVIGVAYGADPYKVVVPVGSPFTTPHQLDPSDGIVGFEGQALIEVKYRFVFERDDPMYGENPYLLLEPTGKSLERLPYLIERDRAERPESIYIMNPREAAKVLLGVPLSSEVIAGAHTQVEGTARVRIDRFEAGYECDAPSFVAYFVAVEETLAAAHPVERSGDTGC